MFWWHILITWYTGCEPLYHSSLFNTMCKIRIDLPISLDYTHILSASPLLFQTHIVFQFSLISWALSVIKPPHLILDRSFTNRLLPLALNLQIHYQKFISNGKILARNNLVVSIWIHTTLLKEQVIYYLSLSDCP